MQWVCLNIVKGKCLSGCFVIIFYVYVVYDKTKKKKRKKKLNVLICIEFGSYFKKISKIFFWYRGL
jgi:hypothetical protein